MNRINVGYFLSEEVSCAKEAIRVILESHPKWTGVLFFADGKKLEMDGEITLDGWEETRKDSEHT